MSIHQHTYGPLERLKSRKRIDRLFREGKRLSQPPLLVIYRVYPGPQPATLQAGVTVRKKQFKRAVDRNRVKRLLREAYRLQNGALKAAVANADMSLDLFVLYTGQAMPSYADLYGCMTEALRKLTTTYAAARPA